MKKIFVPILIITLLFTWAKAISQPLNKTETLTRQDTLRGSITPEREWWNVLHYNITVQPDYNTKTIKGSNEILFAATRPGKIMQIDLQEPMQIDSVITLATVTEKGKIKTINKVLSFTREGNVFYIDWKDAAANNITIYYHGKPREAVRPPWDGGWIWKTDAEGNPWMSVACQGLGASVWYPCKDIQSDEPDNGAVLNMIVPDDLVAVGNGRNIATKNIDNGYTKWSWEVKNPINNYTIIPYIGKYQHFGEVYNGLKGKLDCDYWVLKYNVTKAKEQFKQAPMMLKCFEYWFGPYPFYEDSYKLVEAPHLGMEHQSATAYGNKFQNGYLGTDLSGTGWGLKWDYIIIHESGHEWFANNITTNDIADMWVHEGFTDYSETLYVECQFGKAAGTEYVAGLRKNIQNDIPIIGKYGVNKEGSSDMYYKGANLIHNIRTIINDDAKFRAILTGLNQTFYHQTVTTQQVEEYISQQSGINFSKVFDEYLRTTQIPQLQYSIQSGVLSYRWGKCVAGFDMKVKIILDKETWLSPTTEWQTLKTKATTLTVDKNFYVNSKEM